jgi:hypothetical protein
MDFCAYLRSRSDSPPDFFLHGGMAALSAVMGSKVWCDGWSRFIYPNLWVVNIAPSGYGKSVAIDMAETLVDSAGYSLNKLPGSFSQEGLIRYLAEHPQGVWWLQEFSSFLSILGRGYNDGAQQWLTEAFDVPYEMPRVLTGERIVLRKPCITILGASSPAWFAAVYQESALRGGFLARFLFCPSTEVGEYVGHPGPRNDGIEATLAWHLKKVGDLAGKVDASAIMPTFREWDEARRVALRKDCPPEFAGMRSRAGLMVLKCAMLFHVSHDPESLVLEPKDLAGAIRYVESAHAKAEKFLTEEVPSDAPEADRMRVREILLRHNGCLDWSTALKRSRMDKGTFRKAVETMSAVGDVAVGYDGKSRVLTLVPGNSPGILGERQNGYHPPESGED